MKNNQHLRKISVENQSKPEETNKTHQKTNQNLRETNKSTKKRIKTLGKPINQTKTIQNNLVFLLFWGALTKKHTK